MAEEGGEGGGKTKTKTKKKKKKKTKQTAKLPRLPNGGDQLCTAHIWIATSARDWLRIIALEARVAQRHTAAAKEGDDGEGEGEDGDDRSSSSSSSTDDDYRIGSGRAVVWVAADTIRDPDRVGADTLTAIMQGSLREAMSNCPDAAQQLKRSDLLAEMGLRFAH
jgi:hypothetical protein